MSQLSEDWIIGWTVRHKICVVYSHPYWSMWTFDTARIKVFAPYHTTWVEMANEMRSTEFNKFTKIVETIRKCLTAAAMDELLQA